MNLILLDGVDFCGRDSVRIGGHRARHIANVLRCQTGDTIRIGRVDGPRGAGTVKSCTEHAVELSCRFELEIPARPSIDLLLALPRPKVLKRLWAQLAAVGVGRIILTNADRVERNYFDTHVLDPAFYSPLLIEGLQQAQDTRLPRVTIHRRLKPLLEDELPELSDADMRIFADPGASGPMPTPALRRRALLAVGPEGGWVPFEREMLGRHGFTPFHLGSRSLRTDTACIALLAILHQRMAEV